MLIVQFSDFSPTDYNNVTSTQIKKIEHYQKPNCALPSHCPTPVVTAGLILNSIILPVFIFHKIGITQHVPFGI